MQRLRTFLKRHLLWVGFCAVVVPLLSILALQYWSLAQLEKTSTVYDKVWMKNYLADVSKEMKFFYRSNAEQTLTTPAYKLNPEGLQKTRYLFGKCDVEIARRLFIVVFEKNGASQLHFYEPGTKTELTSLPAAEARAVNVASAPFKLMSEDEGGARARPSQALTLDDHDLENRILLKPITDEGQRVVGVTGMILDMDYFKNTYLPQVVNTSLPKFFPDNAQEKVIVAAYDGEGKLVMSTQPFKGLDDEASTNFPYFGDWHLAIRSRNMTPEQWAHWNFKINLSFSIFLTLALLGGISLALRAASREMRLSQMKTDFVSNVSHELRTPLSSIRVFGEFLKLGRVKEQPKVCEYGEYIETESRRLTQLINNILDFSKIESDRKTYNFERANIAELISETLKTFDVQLRQQGFQIVLDTPHMPLPACMIDVDAIAQALMNLLDNAVKYSGSSRLIRVRLDQSGGFIRIAVTDGGIGIAREEQSKIFEKFYRVSTGLVHDVKGSGLGLSLVKHIVKAHKGSVTVSSEPGRGSTFTISLPSAPAQDEPRVEQELPKALRGNDTALGINVDEGKAI